MLERVTGSGYARGQMTAASGGLEITDVNGDGIPDSREQVKATYDYIIQNGVPLLVVGITGTREQSVVKAAREALTEDLEVLLQNPLITRVGVTGSPFVREGQLGATTNSLQTSLPIAAAAALVLLLLTMRSLRYAVVTIIPIGLVVAWLYALMYLLGFSLNFVTATIGAISIGVGIDYSIHMTERFREELRRATTKMQALQQAVNGTGVALMASAVSSIVGFAISRSRTDVHVLVLRISDGHHDLPGAGRLSGGPSLPVAAGSSREGGPGRACSCHGVSRLASYLKMNSSLRHVSISSKHSRVRVR